MQDRLDNIFFNIIKNETSLTEVFCNLLYYKAFRDLFLDIVNKKRKILKLGQLSLSSIQYENFSTEKSFGEDENCFDEDNNKIGRGDLVLKYNNDIEYIYELKIERYTQLTKNQPEGYLCYLKDDTRLFFIIPRGYLHINDIYNRWHQKTNYSKKNIENHIIYWEDILKEIKRSELNKLNLFIDEFCKILEYRWFDYIDIEFSNFEIQMLFKKQGNKKKELSMLLDTNIPKIVSKLFEIIEDVKVDTRTEKAYVTQNYAYYGRFVKNENIPKEWEVWFGVDFKIWEKYQVPLTIQIFSDNEDEMEKIKNLEISTHFLYEDESVTTFIGLDKKIFEDKTNNIVREFENKINDVVEKIVNKL